MKDINLFLTHSDEYFERKFNEVENEYKESERILRWLNNDKYQDRSHKQCEPGEHHILLNEFAEPQCKDLNCLRLFTWRAVRKELLNGDWTPDRVIERYGELKEVAMLIKRGTPPKNVQCYHDNVYRSGQGFISVTRCFYDKD